MGALETADSLLPYGVDSLAGLDYVKQYLSGAVGKREPTFYGLSHYLASLPVATLSTAPPKNHEDREESLH